MIEGEWLSPTAECSTCCWASRSGRASAGGIIDAGATMARRRRAQRRYSDDERAAALAALAANGGNLSQTARQLGIPKATLRAWRDGAAHPEASENSTPKKAALAHRLEEVAHQILDGMTAERLLLSAPHQAMTALGIAVDKMQLLRGRATAITDQTHVHLEMSEEEVDARLAELRAQDDGADAPGAQGPAPGPS